MSANTSRNQQQHHHHHHQHHHPHDHGPEGAAGCNTCAERGFVTKTATPHFPRKKPPVDSFVCHGCAERAAILSEVDSLREMVLALSNGMLELNTGMHEHKRKISWLEAELAAANAATAKAQAQLDRAEHVRHQQHDLGSIGTNVSGTAAAGVGGAGLVNSLGVSPTHHHPHHHHHHQVAPASGLSALVEKMLNNSSLAIEARIAANVRDAEAQRSAHELKSIREEMNRKMAQLQRDVERDVTALSTKVDVSQTQLHEDVGALSRRLNRAIHQLVESLKETGAHVAAPPAVSEFGSSS